MSTDDRSRLNAICPYFTMFPLDFPLSVLREYAAPGSWVIDPFCGRGTTNYASRILGLSSLGIDSSPVAVAASRAKLVQVSPKSIRRTAELLLREAPEPRDVPQGEFWDCAFNRKTLYDLCKFREVLLRQCKSDVRIALRGVLLGALHGPLRKNGNTSYLSNQCPRTYAPKPAYSVRYWRDHAHKAPEVNLLDIVAARAERYYTSCPDKTPGKIVLSDSRNASAYRLLNNSDCPKIVVTSPPYFGMRTYVQDQWMRYWLLGGPSTVDYREGRQLSHRSALYFAAELRRVWQNTASICPLRSQMVIRYGAINDRKADPEAILMNSLRDSGWTVVKVLPAGSAANGKRQADHFLRGDGQALEEFDLWAVREAVA